MAPISEEKIIKLLNAHKSDILQEINTKFEDLSKTINETKSITMDAVSLSRETQNDLETVKRHIKKLEEENGELKKYLDDQINRQMRNTLDFKGIHQDPSEKSWDHTGTKLIDTVTSKARVPPDPAKRMFE